ncbi:leucyl aminopeptidase [Runella slithyformis]|uniref:Probable cytosol aminopeptidase n=1 Tax=Runella slithyformis (strain ATCC 29530 / DSM 19594 / LMG 11500 / NCIMB 11436 / LSU 4) TaxID=761193 RepID=A0A7U3ZNH9_RUNSL|nr:leucyl aminopeptidase [Runella slithyformis]AEI50333.1 cytosol aminopeptidase [Runella slithyformis DSM 19594]
MEIQIVNTLPSETEAIIYLFRQGDTLSDQLSVFTNAAFLKQDFKAEAKQVITLYENDRKVYLVGLGKNPREADFIKILRSFFYKQKRSLPNLVALDLMAGAIEKEWVEVITNGILLGDYDLDLYKTTKKEDLNFFEKDTKLQFIIADAAVEAAVQQVHRGEEIAFTQIRIMDLMNAPSNKKSPQSLAEWATDSGEKYGYSVTVWDEKQCESEGLEALLAVSFGSRNPPRFIQLEYKHPNANKKIGLVGKGVTFDTGGISLKQSANMHYMKSDMGGAAAVLGTIEAAAKLQLPVHLIGIIPATENSIDGLATKPGDVVGSYSGKTIEIIDTDAEGRVILADALSYLVRNHQPDTIIDLATLTGSCVAALGYSAAGMFTDNDQLAQELYESGQQTGEKLWRLPLWDDYKEDVNSDVADVKNFHGKPFAGAIVAAKFLEVFVEEHPRWAHLDIAGTAFGDSEFGTMKSATGYGIRLLLCWLQERH